MPLKLMFITNKTEVARIAQNAGVDRIIIDLEKLGKIERQGHLDSVKSDHEISDISKIKPILNNSELVVRVNPLNKGSAKEIDSVINCGADIVMLPMFKTGHEVKDFIDIVSGRAKIMLLLETSEAENCIDDILNLSGIDEIHIGLNDLHLSHGMKFMFELLSNGTVENLCRKISSNKIPFGFGGISRIGDGTLPAERILAEHYRLKSSMVILSRRFCDLKRITNTNEIENIFIKEVKEIRDFEKYLSFQSETFFKENSVFVKSLVDSIIKDI